MEFEILLLSQRRVLKINKSSYVTEVFFVTTRRGGIKNCEI